MMDEAARRMRLEALRPLPPDAGLYAKAFDGIVWSDQDVARMRAAFQKRFDEPVPRTETLFAVAAEGVRIYLERAAEKRERGE